MQNAFLRPNGPENTSLEVVTSLPVSNVSGAFRNPPERHENHPSICRLF